MSRQAGLSFIRSDLYDEVRRRMMPDMAVSVCQLSKLYAYSGLVPSSGVWVNGGGIDWPGRVIVGGSEKRSARNVPVLTVEEDGGSGGIRSYRSEGIKRISPSCSDGEGLIFRGAPPRSKIT